MFIVGTIVGFNADKKNNDNETFSFGTKPINITHRDINEICDDIFEARCEDADCYCNDNYTDTTPPVISDCKLITEIPKEVIQTPYTDEIECLNNYTRPTLSELNEHVNFFVDVSDKLNKSMNINGSLGGKKFICFPTNETTSFGSRVFDCKWTSEPKPTKLYEEGMYWNNDIMPPQTCNRTIKS